MIIININMINISFNIVIIIIITISINITVLIISVYIYICILIYDYHSGPPHRCPGPGLRAAEARRPGGRGGGFSIIRINNIINITYLLN